VSGFKEFRYGWPVVLASTLGIALGMSPLPFYTIGVFAGPLKAEFGWTIDRIMSGLVVFTLVAFAASPLVGNLSDRLGVRRVALGSMLLFSLAMMSFALNTGSVALYYLLWGVLAFVGAGTLPMTFTRAISNWFNAKRGLALGVALIGTGLSGALTKLYAAWVIAEYGWRAAYLAVGALPLLVAFPVAWFCFRDVDDPRAGARARGLNDMRTATNTQVTVYGLTARQAFLDWRFWLLAAIFVPLSFAVGGPIPNMETILGAKGFSTADAVLLASFLGYSVFVGRLIGGYLLDVFWAPAVACVLLLLPAVSMYLLTTGMLSYSTALLSVVLIGVAAGMEYDLLAYLVSRYFGIRSYATIYGCLYAFFALGAGFGPAVFGWAYEQSGSYNQVLIWSMWAFIGCSFALLFLGRYRDDQLRAMVAPPAG
jgi:MFS family permease